MDLGCGRTRSGISQLGWAGGVICWTHNVRRRTVRWWRRRDEGYKDRPSPHRPLLYSVTQYDGPLEGEAGRRPANASRVSERLPGEVSQGVSLKSAYE